MRERERERERETLEGEGWLVAKALKLRVLLLNKDAALNEQHEPAKW